MNVSMNKMNELLNQMNLPQSAVDFLTMLWGVIQFFDDVKDGDPVKEFDQVLLSCILGLPCNQFYSENKASLAPALHVAIEKWHLANRMEENKQGDARSFMWRAGYWDIVALTCALTGNPNIMSALAIYGENFEEYLQEVNHA